MGPGELIDCVFARWSPQLGDPSVMGWVTVASYFAACILAGMVCVKENGRQRAFWLTLALLLAALAVNKQLDLQSALTATGRCISKAQGWYADRRPVQVGFILIIIVMSILAAMVLVWAMCHHLLQIWVAILGVTFLLTFVAVRAAGFHDFDKFIGFEVGIARMNWLFEIGGISLIATNALYQILPKHRRLRLLRRHT